MLTKMDKHMIIHFVEKNLNNLKFQTMGHKERKKKVQIKGNIAPKKETSFIMPVMF